MIGVPLTPVCTTCSLGAYSRVYYSICLPLGASTQCSSYCGIGSRRGWKGPRHWRECSNAQNLEVPAADPTQSAAIWRNWPVSQAHPAQVTVTGVTIGCSNLLPGASHRHNRVMRRLELLRFPSIARCCKVTGTRRRAARSGRNLELRGTHEARGHRTGGQVGVAGNPGARPIIDLPRLIRVASENFGRPSQKPLVYR
jgi:hypothetical protein